MKKYLLFAMLFMLLFSTALFADNEFMAEITDCQGTAYFRNLAKPDSPWELLTVDTVLHEEMEIYTDKDSFVELVLGNLFVRINPGTRLVLKNLAKQGGTVRLECQLISGGIWSKVIKTINNLLHYEVVTPTAVAGVEGTNFSVDASTEATEVLVAEGLVLLKTREVSGQELRLKANEKARVSREGIVRLELQERDEEKIGQMNRWGRDKERIFEEKTETNKAGQADPVKKHTPGKGGSGPQGGSGGKAGKGGAK
ncbi:MAG TPA: FecR family protein [Peptococcaceae bacterium]|nr:FecR family protein [Peptococcaceae bacterium]